VNTFDCGRCGRGTAGLSAPEVGAECGKFDQVSAERTFVVGMFLTVERFPSQHAVSIEQLLMMFDQSSKRVRSFSVTVECVHGATTVRVPECSRLFSKGHFRGR